MRAARLVLLLTGLAACLAGAAELPRSLVSRMLDARENFTPPAKAMRTEPDPDAAKVAWPFDVPRIERMLERQLDRAEDGTFVRRAGLSEGASLRERADDALAYVNRVFREWGALELDARFPRCDEGTVRALAAYQVDLDAEFWTKFAVCAKKGALDAGPEGRAGWVAGWKVADRIYLLLTCRLSAASQPCDYQFVMWDGRKDWPIAGFDEFPDAARAGTVLRVLSSPAAANNLAARLHARDAGRAVCLPEYQESLLRRAAAGGSEAAFHNLGVLMEEQGDAEQAAAYYSRGAKPEK